MSDFFGSLAERSGGASGRIDRRAQSALWYVSPKMLIRSGERVMVGAATIAITLGLDRLADHWAAQRRTPGSYYSTKASASLMRDHAPSPSSNTAQSAQSRSNTSRKRRPAAGAGWHMLTYRVRCIATVWSVALGTLRRRDYPDSRLCASRRRDYLDPPLNSVLPQRVPEKAAVVRLQRRSRQITPKRALQSQTQSAVASKYPPLVPHTL